MNYHSNHFTCHNSNWENKPFENAEVCVTIYNTISIFSDINKRINNPDFDLLLEEKDFYNNKYQINDVINTLKQNVLEWLDENVEDQKDISEDINGDEIIIDRSHPSLYKGWCINSDQSTRYGECNIYFTRQLDALKFIKTFSIFKEPITYFDYFHYDKREMEITKIIETINKYSEEKIELNNIEFKIDNSSLNNLNYNNLDIQTFKLLDWESVEFDVSDDKKEEYYNILNNIQNINESNDSICIEL